VNEGLVVQDALHISSFILALDASYLPFDRTFCLRDAAVTFEHQILLFLDTDLLYGGVFAEAHPVDRDAAVYTVH
jgi:hypothetical protein